MTSTQIQPETELGEELARCELGLRSNAMVRIHEGKTGAFLMWLANFTAGGFLVLFPTIAILHSVFALPPGPMIRNISIAIAVIGALVLMQLENWAWKKQRLILHKYGIRYRSAWSFKWTEIPFHDLERIEVGKPPKPQSMLGSLVKVVEPSAHRMVELERKTTVVFHMRNGSQIAAKSLMAFYPPEEALKFWESVYPMMPELVVHEL